MNQPKYFLRTKNPITPIGVTIEKERIMHESSWIVIYTARLVPKSGMKSEKKSRFLIF